MKTGRLILLIAALLGVAAFTGRLVWFQQACPACAPCPTAPADAATALAWMKVDLRLDESEFARVRAMHEAYLPQCDAMCARMAATGEKLSSALLQSGGVLTPEAEAALRELEAERAACQRATLRHIAGTAAVMRPAAARAYLEKVLPHLLATHQHLSEVSR